MSATIAFFVQVTKGLILSLSLLDFILITIITFICLYLLNGSRKAKKESVFKTYHIGWHIVGGLAMSYMVYLEHYIFYNLDHPIFRLKDYVLNNASTEFIAE